MNGRKIITLVLLFVALSKTAFAMPMPDGAMMKEGKMLMIKDGKSTEMVKEMTTADGTKVMKDGSVMTKDGHKSKLKDDEMMDTDGHMLKMKDGTMEMMPTFSDLRAH